MKNKSVNAKDDFATPDYVYQALHKEFNFDFDPCPFQHDINLWDGLNVEWGLRNFVNPPYSLKLKEAFILKGIEEMKKGNASVFLLPVTTGTKIFQEIIFPLKPEIRFVKGRIKFRGWNKNGQKLNWDPKSISQPGQNESMIIIFGKDYKGKITCCEFKK